MAGEKRWLLVFRALEEEGRFGESIHRSGRVDGTEGKKENARGAIAFSDWQKGEGAAGET